MFLDVFIGINLASALHLLFAELAKARPAPPPSPLCKDHKNLKSIHATFLSMFVVLMVGACAMFDRYIHRDDQNPPVAQKSTELGSNSAPESPQRTPPPRGQLHNTDTHLANANLAVLDRCCQQAAGCYLIEVSDDHTVRRFIVLGDLGSGVQQDLPVDAADEVIALAQSQIEDGVSESSTGNSAFDGSLISMGIH